MSEVKEKVQRRRRSENLGFEVVEVPAEQGALDELLDLIADLLVRKWMDDQEMLKIDKPAGD